FDFSGRDEVGFVQKDHVGEGDLLLHLAVAPVQSDVPAIDHGDDAVQAHFLLELVVEEERLHNRPGVGQSGGLDQDVVEPVLPLHQVAKDADQVAANSTADAPIIHLEYLFLGPDHQVLVHPHLAELVLDDGNPLAVLRGEDVVEEGGLAGPEEAGQNGDGDAVGGCGHTWVKLSTTSGAGPRSAASALASATPNPAGTWSGTRRRSGATAPPPGSADLPR